MSNIKKIGIILLVAIAVSLMSSSFSSSDILNRSVIIGMGLDLSDDNNLVLTAEVVSPGNGGEQVGTFSKTVTVQGETISQAIQQVSQKTGKEASLGQCALLVLGESLYTKVDFTQIIDFFINSYNFKESSTICCAKGSAQDILNYGEALSQSVSLALISMLQEQASTIAIPTNSLLEYARSQKELTCWGFINYVEFVPSQNKDEQNPDKPQGYFSYQKMAVFQKNNFVNLMDTITTKGFALLNQDVNGDVFVVKYKDEKLTFIIDEKEVSTNVRDDGVDIQVQLKGRLARTDDFGANGFLTVQTEKQLDPQILADVKNQAMALVQNFLNYQQQFDADLIGIDEQYRQKQGTTDFVTNLHVKDLPITFKVTVEQH